MRSPPGETLPLSSMILGIVITIFKYTLSGAFIPSLTIILGIVITLRNYALSGAISTITISQLKSIPQDKYIHQ